MEMEILSFTFQKKSFTLLQGSIEIKDVSADAFSIILHFIYTNEIAENSDHCLLLEIWRGRIF